jgi:asparagine synthase (glutamine-hydrolysing)
MCGINGFNFVDENLIRKMNDVTRHRGPDDSGFCFSQKWSLGHNRLSIIDLSQNGHQPMFSRDKKLAIIFNGEIYNFKEVKKELLGKGYKFNTQTDTEVVLIAYQAWGKNCLQKFNGMFSFAILDIEKEELFLARDRIGIKPLYYYYENGKFIFSSEVKAILKHSLNCSLNIEALNMYFRLLYVPSPLTIWQNIYKLEPAHCAFVKNGNLKIERYWKITNSELIYDINYIKSEVFRILHDSVEKRLMSDRPRGIFLSGGIDSTIIAGLASSFSEKVNTFSVGFEETEDSKKYNNDMLVARRTAKFFNTNHHEYILSAQDIKNNLERTIYHLDEPVSNHIQTVNLLLSQFASEHVKVVLAGDGGDELFGGYERYYYSFLINKIQKIPLFLRKNFVVKNISSVLNKSLIYNKINCPIGTDLYLDFFAQKEKQVNSFLRPEYNQSKALYNWMRDNYFEQVDKNNFTRQFMQTDLSTWMPDESLLRSDKMAMASGLEQRVPFLDHRLVELADRIPIKYKIGEKGLGIFSVSGKYNGKTILKEAMSEYLPDFVLNQPKWGWFSPAARWLRDPLNEYVLDILSPSYCPEVNNLFDFKAIRDIFNKHVNGQEYALNTIWSIMTFQIWYKTFIKNKK